MNIAIAIIISRQPAMHVSQHPIVLQSISTPILGLVHSSGSPFVLG